VKNKRVNPDRPGEVGHGEGSQSFSSDLNVRFGSKADISLCNRHVRFTPESGHSRLRLECPLSAIADIRELICANRKTALQRSLNSSAHNQAAGASRTLLLTW
jgi:hypothetical protein